MNTIKPRIFGKKEGEPKFLHHKNSASCTAFFLYLAIVCAVSTGLFLNPHPAHADTTTGLVGWWKFDEGSGPTAIDSSGSGYNGTEIGNPTYVTGAIEQGLQLNGTSQYVDIPNSISFGSNSFSVSAWINPTSTGNDERVVNSCNLTADICWLMDANASTSGTFSYGSLRVRIEDSNAVNFDYSVPNAIQNGSWQLVTFVVDRSANTVSVYVNGVQVGTTQNETFTGTVNTGYDINIGTILSQLSDWMEGGVDDVRIYDRALSSADVGQLYALASQLPELTTSLPTLISTSSATLNANISSIGSSSITQSGFIYGTSSLLTSGVSTTTLGAQSAGAFNQALSGLLPNTTYYLEAYATNSFGSNTGALLSTTTTALVSGGSTSTVVTSAPTSVTEDSATFNGSIAASGGRTITQAGFIYGTSSTLMTGATTTTLGAQTGTPNLSETVSLSPNTTYYFEAYAVNALGTSTGAILSTTTQAGLQYTFNGNGLTSLSYDGQSYMTGSPNDSVTAYFATATGTIEWNHGNGGYTSTTSTSSITQTFQPSGEPGLTIQWTYTEVDPHTLKTEISVTNNDATDTLAAVNLEYFLQLITPGYTCNTYWCGGGANIGIGKVSYGENYYSPGPVTFLSGSGPTSWGSLAIYSDNYTSNWTLGSATSGNTSSPYFLMDFANSGSNGGNSGTNTLSDPIPPGQTHNYDYYISFGTPTDTPATLASSSFATWQSEYPDQINWQHNAPIARWFIANGTASSTNPRAYNFTSDITNQANFDTEALAAASTTIATMNMMNPRPQGVVIWDLEGQEFYQPFTYVGNPNKLPLISPEMNAVADQLIAKIQNAGYQVGLTLRPSNFGAGPTLPATCYHDSNQQDSDVFVLTTASWPYQGYECTATNTWTQPGADLPAHQTGSDVDSVLLSNLESKVAYAQTRWGIHMFYVDSTVYGDAGTGFSYLVWRSLMTAFPNDLFIAEEPGGNTSYGSVAGYSAPGDIITGFEPAATVQSIYPNAFNVYQPVDSGTINLATTSANYAGLLQAVEGGNILFFDGWFNSSQNAQVAAIYQAAGFLNSTTTPTVTTYTPAVVSSSQATLNAGITLSGGSSVTQSGFAYGTDPTLSSVIATTTLGSQSAPGSFSQNISGLSPGTTYYARAYATNSAGTSAGSVMSFQVSAAPTVTTQTASTTSGDSIIANGTLTATGGINPFAEGFAYGTTTSYGATSTNQGFFATSTFSSSINGLACNTLYHVIAYATNSGGTSYGSDQQVTTASCTPPTLTVQAASSISGTGAVLNGTMASDGGASSTVEGFNWGTDTTYGQTVYPNSTFGIVFGNGTFSKTISGLSCGTVYQFQAFATNSAGEGSSTDETFTTSACSSSGGGGGGGGGIGGGGGGGGGFSVAPTVLASSTATTTTGVVAGCPAGWVCTPNTTSSATGASVSNSGAVITENLSVGSSGPQVTLLQTILNSLGFFNGPITGYFGSITEQAVKNYQASEGITPIGSVGPLTRAALNAGESVSSATTSSVATSPAPTTSSASSAESTITTATPASSTAFIRNLAPGSNGPDVLLLQKTLNSLGFVIASTGAGSPGNETEHFGNGTESALQKYQCAMGIVCSGSPDSTGYGFFGPKTRSAITGKVLPSIIPALPVTPATAIPTVSVKQTVTSQNAAPAATTTNTATSSTVIVPLSSPSLAPASSTAATTNTALPLFTETLRIGSTGAEVKELQVFLNTHGFQIASSGPESPGHETETYDDLTANAVAEFQQANAAQILAPYGLTQGTGSFGEATMDAVNAIISK